MDGGQRNYLYFLHSRYSICILFRIHKASTYSENDCRLRKNIYLSSRCRLSKSWPLSFIGGTIPIWVLSSRTTDRFCMAVSWSWSAWYIFTRILSIVYRCVAIVSVHGRLKSRVDLFFWWETHPSLVISVHFGTLRNNAILPLVSCDNWLQKRGTNHLSRRVLTIFGRWWHTWARVNQTFDPYCKQPKGHR